MDANGNSPTGYNWNAWLNEARTATENNRRVPFMLDPRELTPNQQANTSLLYPDIQQTQGMQPIIGPNGKNIAPSLAGILGVADPNDASKLPGGQPLPMNVGLSGLIEYLQKLGLSDDSLNQVQALATPPKVYTGAEMAQAGQALMPGKK